MREGANTPQLASAFETVVRRAAANGNLPDTGVVMRTRRDLVEARPCDDRLRADEVRRPNVTALVLKTRP